MEEHLLDDAESPSPLMQLGDGKVVRRCSARECGDGEGGLYIRFSVFLLIATALTVSFSELIGVCCALATIEHPRGWVVILVNIAFGVVILAAIVAAWKVVAVRVVVESVVPGYAKLVPVTLLCVGLGLVSGASGGAIGAHHFASYIRAVRLGEVNGVNASVPTADDLKKGLIGFDATAYIQFDTFAYAVRTVKSETRTMCVAPVVEGRWQREVSVWAVHNDSGTDLSLCCYGKHINHTSKLEAPCPGWGRQTAEIDVVGTQLLEHEIDELNPAALAQEVSKKSGLTVAADAIFVRWIDDKNDDVFTLSLWSGIEAYVITLIIGISIAVLIIGGLAMHALLQSKQCFGAAPTRSVFVLSSPSRAGAPDQIN